MEHLRDDSGTSRDQGSLDNLERARLYFERKAGRPVSTAEAREWLDSLVEYLRTAQRWAAEAAAREATGIYSVDDQLAAHGTTGISSVDAQRAGHEASGISTQDVQQADQASDPDIQRSTQVPDQDALQADQQAVHDECGISSRDIPGLPSPKASRRIAARGRPRISGLNIPTNVPGISMNVRMDEHSARTARSGQE